MRPLPDPDDREIQYKVVDVIVYLTLLLAFAFVVATFFPAT